MDREAMQRVLQDCKECMIDDFANLSGMINEERLVEAAVFSKRLAAGLYLFAETLMLEAQSRQIEDILDKPQDT